MPRAQFINSVARPATAVVLVLVAGFAIMASGVLGSGGAPTPSNPPASPTPAPTGTPGTPTPTPTPAPSDAPVGDLKVDLDNASGFDVSVLIKDRTGSLDGAESGKPKDGMSVRWHDSIVDNVDGSTLRITWVGWPKDEDVVMKISTSGDKVRIHLVQIAPYPNTDALGSDRILVLKFNSPVDAGNVKVTFEDVSPA